tara:strand:- start:42 stop:242 length:201 start_codon:yes stop_codon:yes gene_type:complete
MTKNYKWKVIFKNYFSLLGGKDSCIMNLPLATKDEKKAKEIISKNMHYYFGEDSPSWGIEKIKLLS